MIMLFGNDGGTGRGINNKNTNKTPKAILSIHLAKCGDDCSNDNDGSVGSVESTANDRGTNNDSYLPDVSTPVVNSEFGNNNSDENVGTSDNGSGGDNNDDDDTTPTSGNNDEEIPKEDHPEPEPSSDDTTPNDIDSSAPANEAYAWSRLLEAADDDVDNDPVNFDEFCSDYNLDDDSVFDNDKIGKEEGFCCMTVTNSWDPHMENNYEDDNIFLQHGVFDTGGNPSIHPNFFHGTLNNSIGLLYTTNNPISKTNVLHHALLKYSLRIHRGDIMKSIEHYNAFWCKFQQIGIHNSTDYFNLDSSSSLQLLLTSHGLLLLYQSTIELLLLETYHCHLWL